MRHRRLLHVVPRGQRPENVARRGTTCAAPAAAAHVGVAHHVGADVRRQFPAIVIVGRERVRRVRPGQHVDHGQFGRYRVHVAAGVASGVSTASAATAAAQRAGTRRQQAVVAGSGGRVRRVVAQRLGGGRGGADAIVARQVQYGAVATHQGEHDDPVRRRWRAAAYGGRASRRLVAGTVRRRVAGQRAQHVQLAGGLGRHQPVSRSGNVRMFRPGGRRPGGTVARQNGHRHQPHTVHVRNHTAYQ